jgi:hypothetical protein
LFERRPTTNSKKEDRRERAMASSSSPSLSPSPKLKSGSKRNRAKQWFQSLGQKKEVINQFDDMQVEINSRERKKEKDRKEAKEFVQLTEEEVLKWPLHKTVWKGDIEALKKLLDQNSGTNKSDQVVLINQRDRRGNTPLHIAIHLRRRDIVHILILYGADVTYKNGGGWSPLQEAVAAAEMRTVTELFLLNQIALQKRFENKINNMVLGIERVSFTQQLRRNSH